MDGAVRTYKIDPAAYSLRPASPADLRGDTPDYNAAKMRALLAGEDASPLKDVVLLNAAAALAAATGDIAAGLDEARHSLESGAAQAKMEALIQKTQALAQ
jgi:anthranilate phosphoribosyltransferase